MSRTIVGVLRGGTSSEYGLSLKSGAAVLTHLPEDKFDVRDILIDKKGFWHHRGVPSTPMRALTQVDVVFNALHGGVGEDGTVQRMLEQAGIPYTGSRPLQSALTLNKALARGVLQNAGILMPQGIAFSHLDTIHAGEMATRAHARFAPPYIVKPISEGASHGVRYIPSFAQLPDAIADTIDAHGDALIEEYIRGEEASVGVISNFRNEPMYVLPPAHVPRNRHLERMHHDSGEMKHFVPSTFSYHQKQSLMDIARAAHTALSLSHFSRADLIVNGRGIYLLEVNTNPGLYPGATFPSMLSAVGSSVGEFLDHALQMALSGR
jgi:D-alanine-D-alanine ligase